MYNKDSDVSRETWLSLFFCIYSNAKANFSVGPDGVQLVLGERERAVSLNYIFIYFI